MGVGQPWCSRYNVCLNPSVCCERLFITLGDKYSQIPYKSCFQRVRPKVVMVIHIITAFLDWCIDGITKLFFS